MSDQDVQTIRGGYEAFNSGNIDGVIAILDEDVEWIEPGGGKSPSGRFQGAQSVNNDVFPAVAENFDEFQCQPTEFTDEGGRVIATGRFNGKSKSGAELDAGFEHIWEMEGGKAARFENKVDQDAWAAGWS
jgi:ketosteroid isomerase-like protein